MESKISLSSRLINVLGDRCSPLVILSSGTFALVSFFYLYSFASYFKLVVFPFHNRVTFFVLFDSYIITEHIDHILISSLTVVWIFVSIKNKNTKLVFSGIFGLFTVIGVLMSSELILVFMSLISLPVIIFFIIYNRYKTKILRINSELIFSYIAIIVIIISIISLIITSDHILLDSQESTFTRNYAYDIFLIFSSFSPVFLILLTIYYPTKLIMEPVFRGLKIKTFFKLDKHNKVKFVHKVIWLVFFIVLTTIIGLIPHQPSINPENYAVGVDTQYYVTWIDALMNSNNIQEFIMESFVFQSDGDRPLTLILFFSMLKAFDIESNSTSIEFIPLILSPILILTVFFFTKVITTNDKVSLLASFITAISFQVIIGIYAGFYANWISLIFGFLSVTYMIKSLKKSSKTNLMIFLTLLILLFLTHVYSWVQFVVVMAVFLLIQFKLNQFRRRNIALILVILLSVVALDITRMSLTGADSGIGKDIEIAQNQAGVEYFASRWDNLLYTSTVFLGGQYGNFLILVLGLLWLFRSDIKESHNLLITIFLITGIVPIIFGDSVVQGRVLYNIPFQIPAAIALYSLKNQVGGKMIILSACILLFAISVRDLSHFIFNNPA